MPLFLVEDKWAKITTMTPQSYISQNILEQKLKELLREQFSDIDPDVMIIDTEFNGWEGTNRSIDLLGLDNLGNLVVIELKRTDDGGHMELQSLRYAAMLSDFDGESVVQIYVKFLEKFNQDTSVARETISNFLDLDKEEVPEISNSPRIILISPGISQEVARTIIWLNSNGLNIKYIECKLYLLKEQYYLDIEQVIPLPSVQDYTFKLNAKESESKNNLRKKRSQNNIKRLMDLHIMVPGVRVVLIGKPHSQMQISDNNMNFATFIDQGKFKWDYDEQIYSITGLTKALCKACNFPADEYQGPKFWAIEAETIPLSKRGGDPIISKEDREAEELMP